MFYDSYVKIEDYPVSAKFLAAGISGLPTASAWSKKISKLGESLFPAKISESYR